MSWATHIERYYRESTLAPSGLELHHFVIRSALASAKRKKLVTDNEAQLVDGKPRRRDKKDNPDVRANCWTREEALAFLGAAKEEGPQQAAFYSLELEIGFRKNELAALMWSDVDLDRGTVTVNHQLLAGGSSPTFAPLKSGEPRTLEISAELVELLGAHKRRQSELKLKNRDVYRYHGLLFAKEWKELSDGRAKLGDPLQTNNIGQREFARLIKKAEVKRIRFHGLRHTAATLALLAGVPVKVVSYRLGHAKTQITLDLYSHVIPEMQEDAARKMGSLLHG